MLTRKDFAQYDTAYMEEFPDNAATPFEVTRAIGMRAFALSHGATPVSQEIMQLPGASSHSSSIFIAEQEHSRGILPVEIKRYMPCGRIVSHRSLCAKLDFDSVTSSSSGETAGAAAAVATPPPREQPRSRKRKHQQTKITTTWTAQPHQNQHQHQRRRRIEEGATNHLPPSSSPPRSMSPVYRPL